MRRLTARISGTRSVSERVSGTPELSDGSSLAPLAAAAAAVEMARSLPAERAMLERLELDGDVEEGGGLVTRMTFLIWADDATGLDLLAARLQDGIVAEWTTGATVPSIVPDAAVAAAVAEAVRASGRDFIEDPPALLFATDFGAVSRRVPSALIGVGRQDGWAFHTPLGERQFASEDGVTAALAMANVLALSARRLTGSA
jgi:hypothetical protein